MTDETPMTPDQIRDALRRYTRSRIIHRHESGKADDKETAEHIAALGRKEGRPVAREIADRLNTRAKQFRAIGGPQTREDRRRAALKNPSKKRGDDAAIKISGDLVRENRQKKGMSQPHLARRVGTSRANISRIERNHGGTSLALATRLEKYFGTTLIPNK